MDNETYNKIQEEIKRFQEQLYQIARDVNGNFEEGQKPFGIILMNGDNEGCTTQVLSTQSIAAKMVLNLLETQPEIAEEIKRIQTLQKLERLESFLNAMLPDDKDDDQPNTQATFSVRLVDVRNDVIGGSKLHVVKFLKESKDISLKEATDLVNATPSIIFNNLYIAEAERMVNELTKFGAVCEIVEDEKCSFDVFVTDANGNGSKLARYIAKNFNLSLKEAADIVRSIPCTVATNLSKEMAKVIQKTIEGLGCNASIIPTNTKMT